MAAKKQGAGKSNPLMLNRQSWNRDAVMAHVCNELATSSRSLGSILKAGKDGFELPDYSTICQWMSDDKAISEKYARAKEDQADYLGEEFLELHEKAWVPVEVDGVPLMVNGSIVRTVNKASAAAVRLEADNKKWLMGKLRPKKYGDKIQVGGAEDLPPIQQSVSITPEEAYRRMLDGGTTK